MHTTKIYKHYLELTKPRINMLVLVTTALGYYLAAKGQVEWSTFFFLLLGAGSVCAGSSTLNNYLERDSDKNMMRTKNRVIPQGLIEPHHALGFGLFLILFGVLTLSIYVNLLTAFLSLLTAFLYVLIYTPMKKLSWLNTTIGSIPGALPPMGGWAAATGHLDPGAWVLFSIMFLWQHPHFYAIAWMYKDDYKRGGFKMLPVIEPKGTSTFKQILWYSLILIPVSLLPTIIGLTGNIYFLGSLIAGISMFLVGKQLIRSHSIPDAKKLLHATIVYLPVLFILILLDGAF